jgi:hypothetical protein
MDAPDTRKSSAITDHPFRPRNVVEMEKALAQGPKDPAWQAKRLKSSSPYLCLVCSLAEAAHSKTTVKRSSADEIRDAVDGPEFSK